MILTNELCDILCNAALEESKNVGIDISFTIVDEKGILLLFRRYGDALIASVSIAPNKAYTSAVMGVSTEAVGADAVEGGSLFGINTVDPRITLLKGGFPLYHEGKVVGGIGVGGGTPDQDAQIGQYIVSVFEKTVKNI